MKRISHKISRPFMLIITAIPLATILLFNITMTFYLKENVKNELLNTMNGMDILIKQQLVGGWLDGIKENPSSIKENLGNLRAAIRLTKLAPNTEFLIVSKGWEVYFPISYQDSYLNEEIATKVLHKLKGEEYTTVEINDNHKRYYAVYKPLNKNQNSIKIVFITCGNNSEGMIRVINLILISIMIVGIGISSVIALRISRTISKPFTILSDYAKRIGKGEYMTLEEDSSSVELHDLTKSMNEMSRRLSQHDQAQKSFLQNASHELRTPLMSIQGYAEGIMKGVFPDTVATAGIICEESHRLNSLVEELLALSRIDHKSYQGEPICQSLLDLVKEYIQKLNGYALKEGKSLSLDAKSEDVSALIIEPLLAQACLNIISNCIRYAKESVTVSVFPKGMEAVIRITDDGNGISQKDLPHIFDRFYKGKQGNFGLGLSIALSSIEYMGGEIKAYNDKGAVFEILLLKSGV